MKKFVLNYKKTFINSQARNIFHIYRNSFKYINIAAS